MFLCLFSFLLVHVVIVTLVVLLFTFFFSKFIMHDFDVYCFAIVSFFSFALIHFHALMGGSVKYILN